MIERLHNINGKLDLINDLKIHGLNLSLDQQQKLLSIHESLLTQKFELTNRIKKEYIS